MEKMRQAKERQYELEDNERAAVLCAERDQAIKEEQKRQKDYRRREKGDSPKTRTTHPVEKESQKEQTVTEDTLVPPRGLHVLQGNRVWNKPGKVHLAGDPEWERVRDLAKMLLQGYWYGEYRFDYELDEDGSVEIGKLHRWMCSHATIMQGNTEQRIANILAYAADCTGKQMFLVFQKPEAGRMYWKNNRVVLVEGGRARIIPSAMHREVYQEMYERERDRNWLVYTNIVGKWSHRDIRTYPLE